MKPKVVILSAFLSPFRSGAEACAEEMPLLLRDRYEFVIVTCRGKRSLPKHDMLRGKIPVVRVGLGLGLGLDKWLYPFLAPFEAKKHNPEIVHAILETFAGLALLLCKGMKAKRLLTCQTTNRSFLKGPIVRNADHVTVISNHLKNVVSAHTQHQIDVIPNGVHVSAFMQARKKYPKVIGRILFVGRLEKMKGVDTLLRAFAQLQDNQLRIVGDGSQKSFLKDLARRLGVEHRVSFAGRIPPEELYEEYAKAQVFCGLSESEALGNVFIEAQAAGCVIVTTGAEGIADVLPKTSHIVAPRDIVGTATALRTALKESATHHEADVTRFDWQLIASQYGLLYDRLLSRTRAAA